MGQARRAQTRQSIVSRVPCPTRQAWGMRSPYECFRLVPTVLRGNASFGRSASGKCEAGNARACLLSARGAAELAFPRGAWERGEAAEEPRLTTRRRLARVFRRGGIVAGRVAIVGATGSPVFFGTVLVARNRQTRRRVTRFDRSTAGCQSRRVGQARRATLHHSICQARSREERQPRRGAVIAEAQAPIAYFPHIRLAFL